MVKLNVVIMGQNCEKFLSMCLESVKSADTIVYCDGGSTEQFLTSEIIERGFLNANDTRYGLQIDEEELRYPIGDHSPCWWIYNEYKQDDKQMNGKQRNFYLDFLKKNFMNEWCLALDADEVVEDIDKIKEWIEKFGSIADKYPIFNVKMRHFQNDLGHEDAMTPQHFVPGRLFRIEEDLEYPLGEHVILRHKTKETENYNIVPTTIWHLAHIEHCFSIKKRYDKNMKHSNVHNKDFLDQWYMAHLLGKYPRSEVDPTDVPEVIWKNFGINKDRFYFANRGVELKHPLMVKQWNDYFKPSTVLDLGCGRGPYLYFWQWYVEYVDGIELSQWAVDNSFVKDRVEQGDVSDGNAYGDRGWDLITAIDVLEHLTDEQLDKTLNNMHDHGQQFLISVPVIGDPNLDNDKTHLQFRTKEEWIQKFEEHGIKIKETPKDWMFAHQLFVGVKDG